MTKMRGTNGEELWYDEVVEDSEDKWVVRVRTPDGRDVYYQFDTWRGFNWDA